MANEPRNTPVNRAGKITRGLKLVDAKNTTGIGNTFALGAGYSAFGLQYNRSAASTSSTISTSASVQLQGTIDNTTSAKWYNLGAAVTVNSTAGAVARSTNAVPVHRIRGQVVSFTTGAAKPTVNLWVMPAHSGSS